MSHFTVSNLYQTAVYWGNPVANGYGGYTYADPIEIDCRWEDVHEAVMDGKGVEHITRAQVQVAQDLEEEGMLLLGELVDLDSTGMDDPFSAGAHPIIRFEKIPTLKADAFYRKASI